MKLITGRVFKIIVVLKTVGKVRFYADVYRVMEIDKGNFNTIKNGKKNHYFTVEQIYSFINHYNINANYLFRNEESMFQNKN